MHKSLIAAVIAAAPTTLLAEPSLERGEYLVRGPAACGNCHTPQGPDGPDMSNELGGFMIEKNENFEAWAVNITPGSRVANWTDDELARAIREGIRPDGTVIGPPMPIQLYRGLSDDDLMSIVMFLRTVPASNNVTPLSTYNIALPPSYGPPIESVASIPAGVTVEYGEYLAGPVAHCMECHSTPGPMGPMFDTHFGAGEFEFHGPWGLSISPNITSHPEDGLVDWTDDELRDMITKGVRFGDVPMLPPMGYSYYAKMTPEDVDALILYLRQLPALPDPS